MFIAPDVVAPDCQFEDKDRDIDDGTVDPFLEFDVALVEPVGMTEVVIDHQEESCQEVRYDEIDVRVHEKGINGMSLY